jgi:hypothetical protein
VALAWLFVDAAPTCAFLLALLALSRLRPTHNPARLTRSVDKTGFERVLESKGLFQIGVAPY